MVSTFQRDPPPFPTGQFTFNNFGFPFGSGSPPGDYELKIQSYNTSARLLDEVRFPFHVF